MYSGKVSAGLKFKNAIPCNCSKNLLGIKSNFARKIIVKAKPKITVFINS